MDGKLAIFSFREEAEAFLGHRGSDGSCNEWRIKEFRAEELVCLLDGYLSGFRLLVLDPLPEVSDRMVDSLVSIGRTEFSEMLSCKSRGLSTRPVEE